MSDLKLCVVAVCVFFMVAYVTIKEDWLGIGGDEDDKPLMVSGRASYYGEAYRGRTMANGKQFNPDALTCASWEWPLGTWLEVRHGNRTVVVEVTDRGPARSLGRLVDLSMGAFLRLSDLKAGVVDVSVRQIAAPKLTRRANA